jgi:hypothetical protein
VSTFLFVLWALISMIELSPVTSPIEFAASMVLGLVVCSVMTTWAIYTWFRIED